MLASLTDIASNTKKFGPVVRKLLFRKTAASVAAAAGQAGAAMAGTGTAAAASGATAAAATAGAASATAGAASATAGAASATAGVAGPAVASGVAAGEATGVGAGVAGATAGTALTAALTAVGVAAVGAAIIQAGNRVVRERDRLADAWLVEWRTATEASILTNAEELMRVTRDIVERRLCSALGADEGVDRRFRLRQAIEDVRRDRALMLEVLGDDHLA
jgi:hypothetical protein